MGKRSLCAVLVVGGAWGIACGSSGPAPQDDAGAAPAGTTRPPPSPNVIGTGGADAGEVDATLPDADVGPGADAGLHDADAEADTGDDADAAPDAGVDAAPTFHDFGDAGAWESRDLAPLVARDAAGLASFSGGAFDGRYVYLVPGALGVLVRYDTKGAFGTTASWEAFDTTSLDARARAFVGAAFDGRYLYLVPNGNDASAPNGLVVRYDPALPFSAKSSYAVFDATAVAPTAAQGEGFVGAIFDGRYVTLVPNGVANVAASGSVVARYDTSQPFLDAGAWGAIDLYATNEFANGFAGGAFDSRALYFAPHDQPTGTVARLDSPGAFADAAAWTFFDTSSLDSGVGAPVSTFYGAAFDGRYVYLAPQSAGNGPAVVARLDTRGDMKDAGAWETFAASAVSAHVKGFFGATFDGRFVYFVPNTNDLGADGIVLRYDTSVPFGSPSSWATFDVAANVDARGVGFVGGVFDGEHVYLVPHAGTVVMRFDARTPAALPAGFGASFL